MRRIRAAKGDGEEGVALLLALFVILLAGVLSLALAGALLAQTKPTALGRKSIRTLGAAEAGFDVALSRIRSANNGTQGVINKLPCATTNTAEGRVARLTGPVSNNPGALRYSVDVAYFRDDPANSTSAWRASPANRTQLDGAGCPVRVPAYALLVSTGSGTDVPGTGAGDANRKLSTVYQFRTTNENVAGGLIHLFDQDTPLCMGVRWTGGGPDEGDKLYVLDCNPTDPGQKWSYTKDLLLEVNGSGLCLESQPEANKGITLEDCDTGEQEQKWSFNDIGRFEGATSTGNTNGWCFTAKANPAVNGTQVVMRQECSTAPTYDMVHTFSPEATVGAGAAGEARGNLVNYRYFGRCLDVTNQDPYVAWLIGYPCKQRPNPAFLTWNQVFSYSTSTKQYRTSPPSPKPPGPFCLQAGSTASPPVSGTRALVTLCNSGETYQKWTRTGDTRVYASSYNILTANGLCLSLLASGPPEATVYIRQWGTIVVETCDGSTEQKWNAPPNLTPAQVDHTIENSGG